MTDWVQHHYPKEERRAFVDFINQQLADDPHVGSRLPINPDNDDFFTAVSDGLILCKMLNRCVRGCLDEKKLTIKENMNQFEKLINHELFLKTCREVGVHVVSVGAQELHDGKAPHLVLGLVWQVIKKGMFSSLFMNHPELVILLDAGKKVSDLNTMSEEDIVLRWVNWHLQNSGSDLHVANFTSDIQSGKAYCALLHALGHLKDIVPTESMSPQERAAAVVEAAKAAKVAKFVTPQDIVDGNQRLNFAFVANLFGQNPMLPALGEAYMGVKASEAEKAQQLQELHEVKQKAAVLEKEKAAVEEKLGEVAKVSDSSAAEIAALKEENARLKEEIKELKAAGAGSGAGGHGAHGGSHAAAAGGEGAAHGHGHGGGHGHGHAGHGAAGHAAGSTSGSAEGGAEGGSHGHHGGGGGGGGGGGEADGEEGWASAVGACEREQQLERMLRTMEQEVRTLRDLLQVKIQETEEASADAAQSRQAAAKLQETFAQVTNRLDEVKQQLDEKEKETQAALAKAKGAQAAYEQLSSSMKAQKEGSLRKQGRGFKSWKKRYFSLRGHMLFYFSDEAAAKAKKPLGVVYVDEYRIAPNPKADEQPFHIMLEHRTLQAPAKGATFLMEAADAADFSSWVEAIKKTIEGQHEPK